MSRWPDIGPETVILPNEQPTPPDEKTTTEQLLECVCELQNDIEELRKIVKSL